jgi:hypothetical protein
MPTEKTVTKEVRGVLYGLNCRPYMKNILTFSFSYFFVFVLISLRFFHFLLFFSTLV